MPVRAIERASTAVMADFIHRFWSERSPSVARGDGNPSPLDVVRLSGIQEIRTAVGVTIERARESVASIVPYVPDTGELARAAKADAAVVARGVRARSIMPIDACGDIHALRYARDVTVLGAEVRARPVSEYRSVIVDGEHAIIAATAGRTGTTGEALLVQSPALVAALVSQFEAAWRLSVRLGAGGSRGHVSMRDARVLDGLARGETDGELAAALGCAVVTVQRVTARLRKAWEVPSRTALALEAARQGWGKPRTS